MCMLIMNKMKKNKYYTVGPFPKSYHKTEANSMPLAHLCMTFQDLSLLENYLSMDYRVKYGYRSV